MTSQSAYSDDNTDMAHIFMITRGINQNVELWKKFMETQMYPWKRYNSETGKEEISQVQGALRPIQLWEYVVPKESVPEVVTVIKKGDMLNNYWGKGKIKYLLPFIRKMLGAKPLPKDIQPVPTNRYIFCEQMGCEIIGVKEDAWMKNFYGRDQEAL